METLRTNLGVCVTLGMLWCGCGSSTELTSSDRNESDETDPERMRDARVRDASSLDAARRDAGRIDAGGADGDPDEQETCAAITREEPAQRCAVDVIWVVDNSPSMLDDIVGVTTNMQSFFSSIESSGADVHIITISAGDLALGTPLQSDTDKYRFVLRNVASEEVFASALETFPAYRDFLRPSAATQIVAVTDDEDDIPASEFVAAMSERLGHDFTLHAIVADARFCGASVGTQYLAAADATGGERISICSGDWATVIAQLTSAVVAAVPLPCSYDLAEAASAAGDFDPQQVAVNYTPADGAPPGELPKSSGVAQCGDSPGWHYDDEANPQELVLCPAACELVEAGGKMEIAFGCAPTIYL